MCSNSQLLKKEEDHLQKVLLENKFPMWALNRVKMKIKVPSRQDQNKKGTNISTNVTAGNQRPYMVAPHLQRLSEGIKMYAENMGYRYTEREVIPSKAS